MNVDIVAAQPADAEAILALQRLAYRREAILYQEWSLPPLAQTLENLQAEFMRMTVLKASLSTTIVGSVRAETIAGCCKIDRLMVHPEYQCLGIGAKLMAAIEAAFPNADRFELFTGEKSEGNIRLYRRLGYEMFQRERLSDRVTLVFMDKYRPILHDGSV